MLLGNCMEKMHVLIEKWLMYCSCTCVNASGVSSRTSQEVIMPLGNWWRICLFLFIFHSLKLVGPDLAICKAKLRICVEPLDEGLTLGCFLTASVTLLKIKHTHPILFIFFIFYLALLQFSIPLIVAYKNLYAEMAASRQANWETCSTKCLYCLT